MVGEEILVKLENITWEVLARSPTTADHDDFGRGDFHDSEEFASVGIRVSFRLTDRSSILPWTPSGMSVFDEEVAIMI